MRERTTVSRNSTAVWRFNGAVQTEYFELDTVEYTRALRKVDEADSIIEKGDSFERLAV